MVKSPFSTSLIFSRTKPAPTEKMVLAVYEGLLVRIVVSKLKTHFTNPLGETRERTPPACPECSEIGFGLAEIDGWLWCDTGECGFRLEKESYFKALEYFDSDQFDLDQFVEESPVVSFIEDEV